MKPIGYYWEEKGEEQPSIAETASYEPIACKDDVLRYMKSVDVFAVAAGILWDIFTGESLGELLAYKDSQYIWTNGVLHYFEKYNMPLPDDFIAHALSQG